MRQVALKNTESSLKNILAPVNRAKFELATTIITKISPFKLWSHDATTVSW